MINTGLRALGPQKVYRKTIASSAASIDLIAAPGTGKRINILGLSLEAAGVTTITLNSGSTEQARNIFKTNDPAWVLPISPDAWIECAANEKFNIGNSGPVQLAGVVVYTIIGDDQR